MKFSKPKLMLVRHKKVIISLDNIEEFFNKLKFTNWPFRLCNLRKLNLFYRGRLKSRNPRLSAAQEKGMDVIGAFIGIHGLKIHHMTNDVVFI